MNSSVSGGVTRNTDSLVTTTDQTIQTSESDTRIILHIESGTEIGAARPVSEFVPETYEKSHAWALGRNGGNDGRTEKTFSAIERTLFRSSQLTGH